MLLQGALGSYTVDPARQREGGQAIVLPATDARGKAVAVRIAKGGNWLARETRLLRRLATDDTEWVVRVLDEGTDAAGRPFVVSPWYPQDLADWLDQPGRRLGERLAALELACAAVARLHRAPDDLAAVLVHRDVKPSNFLVREGSRGLVVVLADLGIAKESVLLDTTQNTGAFTPRYSPPEQQVPIDLPPEPSIDVYGLGVTVFVGIVFREPHIAFALATSWTAAANRLVALHASGKKRTAAEDAEYAALRRLPVRELIDLDDCPPLLPKDEEALAEAVRKEGASPDAVLLRLLPVLRRALDPDPATRLGDARMLVAACRSAREALGETSSLRHRPATTQAAEPASAKAAPQPPMRSDVQVRAASAATFNPHSDPPEESVPLGTSRATWLLAGALGIVGVAGLATCLGAGGVAGVVLSEGPAASGDLAPPPSGLEDDGPPVGGSRAAAADAVEPDALPPAPAEAAPSSTPPPPTGTSTPRDRPPAPQAPVTASPAPPADAPERGEASLTPALPLEPEPVEPPAHPSLVVRCPKPFTIDRISVGNGHALPLTPGSHRVLVTAELAHTWTVDVAADGTGWLLTASEGSRRSRRRVAGGGQAVLECDFEGGLVE